MALGLYVPTCEEPIGFLFTLFTGPKYFDDIEKTSTADGL